MLDPLVTRLERMLDQHLFSDEDTLRVRFRKCFLFRRIQTYSLTAGMVVGAVTVLPQVQGWLLTGAVIAIVLSLSVALLSGFIDRRIAVPRMPQNDPVLRERAKNHPLSSEDKAWLDSIEATYFGRHRF